MKKIMNQAQEYTDDMLKGIYAVHGKDVTFANGDLRCYKSVHKNKGKVAIVTGGGTGHLPLFLGYVGEGMLDGCAVGNVFQSPSAEQIFELSKSVDTGAGVLFIYGNYTGDIMNFDMAAELLEMEDIEVRTVIGADDVLSGESEEVRRGVAGIFFIYKCASAKATEMASLEEVERIAVLAKNRTRTVGFALSPCAIPEVGKPNFTLGEEEMAMGMGIHGEPGIWNGPLKTSKELVKESLDNILKDMPILLGEEVAVLVNGLGATSLEELYILSGDILDYLMDKGVSVHQTFVGEYATSMEMAGASITLLHLNDELKPLLDKEVRTPFYIQI